MIIIKNIRLLCVVSLVLWSNTSTSMNLLRDYDTLIRPPLKQGQAGHLSVVAEHGFRAKGFDVCGDCVNTLQIWSKDQNALKALQGFEPTSKIGQLATNVRSDGASDDGIRGHFNVCGDLTFNTVAFAGRYHFHNSWFLTAYLPVHRMRLCNVNWQEQTNNVSAGDASIKQKLTNNFFENVATLGDGLELGSWRRTGVGDLVVIIEWLENFIQHKPFLKNVQVTWRLGTNFPTGLHQDEDKVFAVPFGYDGAIGVIFGFGLDLSLGDYFKMGGDVQLHHLFGNTRCRRIKTDPHQTELLLLQKAQAYKDFGLIQRFNLHAQFCNMKGLAVTFGYQFFKRGDDVLSVRSPHFSNTIANTDRRLEEHTLHHGIITATYDFSKHLDEDACVKPSISLFARLPFDGKQVAASKTFGGVIAFDF